jgi:hypothetical protein
MGQDDKIREGIPLAVMPDILYRASIFEFPGSIPAHHQQ